MALNLGELEATISVNDEEFEQGLDQAEGRFGQWGEKLQLAAAAAGALVAGALTVALVEAMDLDAAQAELAASIGDEQFAKDLGQVAGKLYTEGWGESVRDNMTAVQAIWSSGLIEEDATDEAIFAITSQAQALAQVLGIEVPDAANYANVVLKSGLAKDSTEAFDLILAGSRQVPMALREDFLEATQEYGQFFHSLGFSGSQAFEALTAASEKGTFGIDKAGDAVKEFTLLSTDMDAAAETYKALGMDAHAMANNLLAGGAQANTAFFQIIDALLAVKDPAEQAKLAISLFGTPLEDMNKAEIPEFLKSMQAAKNGIGDFSGETQGAADALGNNASNQLESFGRKMKMALVEQVAKAVPYLTDMAKWGNANKEWLLPVAAGLGALAAVIATVVAITKIWTITQAALNVVMMMNPIGLIILGIVALIAGIAILYAKVDWFREGINTFFGWIVTAAQIWWSVFSTFWSTIGGWFVALFQGWWSLFSGFWSAIFSGASAAYQWVVDKVGALVGFVTGLPGRLASAGRNMWSWITSTFKAAINAVISGWNRLSFRIPSVSIPGWGQIFGGMTLHVPSIPYLNVGGDITRTGLAVVHTGERVVPAAQAQRLRSGDTTGGGVFRLIIEGTGLLSGLRDEITMQGGNVQTVLGGAP